MAGVLAAAALGVGAVVVSPTAALAANETPCNGRTDFFKVISYPDNRHTETCFANSGTLHRQLTSVTELHAGNNVVTVYWEGGLRTPVFRGEHSTGWNRATMIRFHIS
ncbi:MAG TPA: beta/gamma crystallin domain-containing protein [Catenuloplanes sp.]